MSRLFVRNLPKKCTEEELRKFFAVKGEVTDVKMLKKPDGTFRQVAYIGFRDPAQEDALIAYFNRNYVKTAKILVEKALPQAVAPTKQPTLENYETAYDPQRLFLRNLSYTTTEDDIRGLFTEFGELQELSLPVDQTTQKIKGFAYVKFTTEESAVSAFEQLDRSIFLGRLLHVLPARKRTENTPQTRGRSSYKKELSTKLKEKAANSIGWNTLFLNPDTVSAIVSQKQHTSKSEFLDSEDLAVQVARAEAQILKETQNWMESQGISPAAFTADKQTTPRSETVLLVKNLPANAQFSALKELLERYGELGRVCLHPYHCVCLAEYTEASHAKNAFDNLSLYSFKGTPLYLEWAPLLTFNDSLKTEKTVIYAQTDTVFVKNLSFETGEEELGAFMAKAGPVRSLRIVKNSGMPMGYAFVQYSNSKHAAKALRNLNNSIVRGHSLKLSEAKAAQVVPVKRPREEAVQCAEDNRTKLTVKNLAFEATKAELSALFSGQGEVKSVRIPKKHSGGHRGFGFIEFLSHEDAETAKNSLSNTHLYGRKLVLEWAEDSSTQ